MDRRGRAGRLSSAGGGQEGGLAGVVSVRIGSAAPVSARAGNLRGACAKWPLKPDLEGVTVSGASVTCPAGAGDGRVAAGEWDAAGLSWTSWDMIQNLRRADQAHSGITDATRTERGFHAARIGEIAGQRPFRWVTMGSL